jgi:predicted DNA-binding protein
MVSIQVYLTKKEREGLAALARRTGKSQGRLIREAVDSLLEQSSKPRLAVLEKAAGMWKDRTDLPDFRALRKGWERR